MKSLKFEINGSLELKKIPTLTMYAGVAAPDVRWAAGAEDHHEDHRQGRQDLSPT